MFCGSVPPLEWPDAISLSAPSYRTTRSISGSGLPAAAIDGLNSSGLPAPSGSRKEPDVEPISTVPSLGLTATEPISSAASTVGSAGSSSSGRRGATTAPRQRERDQDEGVSFQGVVVDSVNVKVFE